MRKMLVAMAKDVRVLLIKLADRLHNMRTIASLPEAKQKRIAQETLDIYAPLAHRLGIQDVKWQLEDLAFAVLHPKRYAEIELMVLQRAPRARGDLAGGARSRCAPGSSELHITAEVTGRPKHYWSIYEKMVVRGKEFAEINDLVGVRVIVDSVKDCYGALGSIHALWRPVQGRFKDYIAMPKFNLYQSLHTTVVGPQGKPVEFQIRTDEMHRRAEFGVAAHWGYKEQHNPTEDLVWLQRLVDWQTGDQRPGRVHAEPEDRPRAGRGLRLHAEGPGDHAADRRDAGRLRLLDPHRGRAPLHRRARERPARAARVRVAVGRHVRDLHEQGRRAPGRAATGCSSCRRRVPVRRSGSGSRVSGASTRSTPARTISSRRCAARACRCRSSRTRRCSSQVAESLNYTDLEALHAALGEGHVSAKAVVQRVQRELRGGEEQLPVTVQRPPTCAQPQAASTAGVHVEGLDDVMVRLSRCCTPVPGDEIMGFVTRGRGVSVHRTDCANAMSLQSQADRVIEVDWDHDAPGTYVVGVEIEALDRSRLLRDVADVLSEHHVNILSLHARRPSPTASPGSASSSSSPTPTTSTRSSRR